MDPAILEIFKTLGVAAPMVVLQFWLLSKCETERQTMTAGFLAELQLLGSDQRKDMAQMLERQQTLVNTVMNIGTQRATMTYPQPATYTPLVGSPSPQQQNQNTDWRNPQ